MNRIEFVVIPEALVTDTVAMLSNYPFKAVEPLIKGYHASDTNPDGSFDVPFGIVDDTYRILTGEPVVRIVKAIERIVAETQQKMQVAEKPVEVPKPE